MTTDAGLFDLSGQVALVTGAARGLGRAIAETLAAQGAAVIVSDIDGAGCAAVAEALVARGACALDIACDVASIEQLDRLVERALAFAGRIDLLVCNAGIEGPVGPLDAATDADWQRVMDINLRGPAALTSRVIPGMAARGGGSVVLMSSIAGLRGNRAIGLYGLSKAALAQLARNLAVEWGPRGVRVNAIAPGLVRTPLAAGLIADEAFMARRLAATPLRRVGEPDEIAGVVAMLASRAGGFITGHTLVVDGGTTIGDGS
ncbi:SDR family NAD(P)-dependent oxidoreductase [Derxia lacustris]|uniref:SDR family NAD(P)-dependent oxidoreductase n=1 Tax=Derxia lacustris TaxID=764842 RepID=UPI000A178144|nr:SDR family oxidoreductase [Derxia lacustris]